MNLASIAKQLGGEVCNGQVSAPGPGHSKHDRSLSVKLLPDGKLLVNSFASDDNRACFDYVRQRLGKLDQLIELRNPLDSSQNHKATSVSTSKLAFASRTWMEAQPLPGTLGEKYFAEHRGLDITQLGDLSHCLRWHAGIGAIIGLMTDPITNERTGVHRTFLSPTGSKLERKMLGRAGVIRLLRDEDVELGLGICEGLEDGLAAMLSGWRPIWVCCSAGAIAKFPVLPGIESLTIFADADAAGTSAAHACALTWGKAGREVIIEDLRQ